MKSALIFLVVAVFGVVYGADKCCFPDKWQADIVGLVVDTDDVQGNKQMLGTDKGNLIGWGEHMFFDTANERIREDFIVGDKTSITHLRLFKQNVSYVYNDKECNKFPVGQWSDIIRCVPDNAKASKPYRLGLQPGINVVDYMWMLYKTVGVEFSITDKCTLEKMAIVNTDEESDVRAVFEEYRNMALAVDPNVFNIPDICKNLTQMIPMWTMTSRYEQLKNHVFKFNQ